MAGGIHNFFLFFYWFLWITTFFKALPLWADAFYKSKCLSVCLSVCVSVCPSVCLFTFEVPFNGLFAPLPKVGCPIVLQIQNTWGKVMEGSGLRYEHFRWKIV